MLAKQDGGRCTYGGNVFSGESIGSVRNQKTGLTDGTISVTHNINPILPTDNKQEHVMDQLWVNVMKCYGEREHRTEKKVKCLKERTRRLHI